MEAIVFKIFKDSTPACQAKIESIKQSGLTYYETAHRCLVFLPPVSRPGHGTSYPLSPLTAIFSREEIEHNLFFTCHEKGGNGEATIICNLSGASLVPFKNEFDLAEKSFCASFTVRFCIKIKIRHTPAKINTETGFRRSCPEMSGEKNYVEIKKIKLTINRDGAKIISVCFFTEKSFEDFKKISATNPRLKRLEPAVNAGLKRAKTLMPNKAFYANSPK